MKQTEIELIKKLENMEPDKFYKFITKVLKAYLDQEPCYCRECRKNGCCHNSDGNTDRQMEESDDQAI
ncbi:hypothetical protein [Anaerotruncus colihominis]|jgi:hypothetical protein|uniref:hypothetical protein n=1 Tax=Anaerotruncus colihominis TaxID=169435 RepID=UPI001899759B|nr:hypothetical protein [Anaerotruncus colihominis]MCQ4735449.1 hypothetical protein [Anaerotruncus colihominis]